MAASRRRRWLVGVSGGADSVALLHLLVEAGFRDLVVCHLDHSLRGGASTGDAAFVAALARKLGLPSESGRADVAGEAETARESIETAARRARHAFFKECAVKRRCRRLLLAHHADDQAETVAWNLLRGSHGLKGIPAFQEMRVGRLCLEISRPLLAVRGGDLREWLSARGLDWREDASNAVPDVIRNRLRLEVLPALTVVSGRDSIAMINRAHAGSQDLEEIQRWAVERAGVLDPQGRLHVPALRALPDALQRAVLADYLKRAGVPGMDRALLVSIAGLLDPSAAPAVNLPGGGSIRRRGGRLSIHPPSDSPER